VAAHAGERHDVRLKARAAGGIGRGEYQNDGRKVGHAQGVGRRPRGWSRQDDSIEFDSNLKTPTGMTPTETRVYKTYMCLICGFIYDEEAGMPDEGIAPGTRWEDVPVNWTCPECGARKEDFEMVEV
jgi:rubredoxin